MSGENRKQQTPSDQGDPPRGGSPITSIIREFSLKYWEAIILAARTRLNLAALAILVLGVIELVTFYNKEPVAIIIGLALVEAGVIFIYWSAIRETPRSNTDIAVGAVGELVTTATNVVIGVSQSTAQKALEVGAAGGEALASGLNSTAAAVMPSATAAANEIGHVASDALNSVPQLVTSAVDTLASGLRSTADVILPIADAAICGVGQAANDVATAVPQVATGAMEAIASGATTVSNVAAGLVFGLFGGGAAPPPAAPESEATIESEPSRNGRGQSSEIIRPSPD